MYAKRINRIQPSATLEMTAKAAELRAQGKDVINLSVGEPDFSTPDNIFIKVDLPAPFGPKRPIISPGFISKDILFRTFLLLYVFKVHGFKSACFF